MQRHAYLIICHEYNCNLSYLIKSIDYKYNDIFIHVDKKAENFNYQEVGNIPKQSEISFVPSIEVHWGGYSQVEATLRLLKCAYSSNRVYTYFHLISGQDILINTAEYTYEFFQTKYPKEFIHFESFSRNMNYSTEDKDLTQEKFQMDHIYEDRVKYFHLMDILNFKNRQFNTRINLLLMYVQKFFRINRIKKINFEFQKGTNWFSITNNLAEYILEEENSHFIKKNFQYGNCVDEMFIQTLVYNSNFINQIYSLDETSMSRYIDWNRGTPYIFSEEDYAEIVEAKEKYCFARKISKELAQKIYEENTI